MGRAGIAVHSTRVARSILDLIVLGEPGVHMRSIPTRSALACGCRKMECPGILRLGVLVLPPLAVPSAGALFMNQWIPCTAMLPAGVCPRRTGSQEQRPGLGKMSAPAQIHTPCGGSSIKIIAPGYAHASNIMVI